MYSIDLPSKSLIVGVDLDLPFTARIRERDIRVRCSLRAKHREFGRCLRLNELARLGDGALLTTL